MTAPRHVNFSPPTCSPRSIVDPGRQSDIDSILKDLKTCARKLQAVLSSHRVDLQVLEKLYYKGNNQHRTALFWRRVADVRRYGRRLNKSNIHQQLETLRLSFWGSPSESNIKVLKGPWTHVPDVQFVLCVLERFRIYLVLVDNMEDHLKKAHDHLNLNLQTGAFLQFILTLTAITSRMAVLAMEVGSVLANAWAACYRLLHILGSAQTFRPPKYLGGQHKSMDPRTASTSKAKISPVPNPRVNQEMDEDLGSAVATKAIKSERSDSMPQPAAPPVSRHTEDTVVVEDMSLVFSQPVAAPSAPVVARTTIQRAPTKPTKVKDSGNAPIKRTKLATSGAQDGPTKKKRKKKDEIDDIFGF